MENWEEVRGIIKTRSGEILINLAGIKDFKIRKNQDTSEVDSIVKEFVELVKYAKDHEVAPSLSEMNDYIDKVSKFMEKESEFEKKFIAENKEN